jgi:glycosidase
MQWDAGKNGGFSEAPPWLPVHENHQVRNVQTQQSDLSSILNMTKSLIVLRKENPALRVGDQAIIDASSRHVLSFTRSTPEQTVLILMNFYHRPVHTTAVSNIESWQVLDSNHRSELAPANPDGFTLGPYEVCLLRKN